MLIYLILGIFHIFTLVVGSPIVNGVEVSSRDLNQFSYMSSLQTQGVTLHDGVQHFCGGAMIHPRWILTAAHCVDGKIPHTIVAIIGQRLVNLEDQKRYKIEQIEYHGYDRYTLHNDIALMKLSPQIEDLQFLPLFKGAPPYGQKCKIIGYGSKEYTGKTPNPLSWAYVDLIPNGFCTNILGRIMGPQPENVCAMGKGTDTCQGDSGGPLICSIDDKEYILGITSSGSGCGIPGVPSLYTLVGPYKQWIDNVLENF